MTAILALPVLIAIAGALLYALTDGKPSELGRLMFFCGLFVAVWMLAGKTVRVP